MSFPDYASERVPLGSIFPDPSFIRLGMQWTLANVPVPQLRNTRLFVGFSINGAKYFGADGDIVSKPSSSSLDWGI
jgi:hypothetical protein